MTADRDVARPDGGTRLDGVARPDGGTRRDGGDARDPASDDSDGSDAATVLRRARTSPTADDQTRLAALVPARSRAPAALPGVALVDAALLANSGGYGLAAAAIVTVLWAIATPIYAATAGALLFFALAATPPLLVTDPVPVEALLAVGVAWLVFAPVVQRDSPARALGATAVGAVATGGVVAGALSVGSVPIAAAALVLAATLGLYGVHRYSVVRLAYRDLQ